MYPRRNGALRGRQEAACVTGNGPARLAFSLGGKKGAAFAALFLRARHGWIAIVGFHTTREKPL